MTVIIECISSLINVTDNNDAWWKPEVRIILFQADACLVWLWWTKYSPPRLYMFSKMERDLT